MSRVFLSSAIPHMAPVLVATFGQYFLTKIRFAFPINCFARYMTCSFGILSVLLVGIRRKINASVESIVALSCWSGILIRSNNSSFRSLA